MQIATGYAVPSYSSAPQTTVNGGSQYPSLPSPAATTQFSSTMPQAPGKAPKFGFEPVTCSLAACCALPLLLVGAVVGALAFGRKLLGKMGSLVGHG